MDAIESLQNALPVYVNVYIAIFRYVAPVLALLILLRAIIPLLSFRREPEIWGWLDISDGRKVPITHWETVIGSNKHSDIVIACETPDEDRAVRFAAERQLEDQILEAMEPGCAVALCGGRYMDFNVTLRRLFGFTDGVITDVW